MDEIIYLSCSKHAGHPVIYKRPTYVPENRTAEVALQALPDTLEVGIQVDVEELMMTQ